MQQEELVGELAENEEHFTNVLLVLIMYRGQTSWSAAVGSDIYSWGRNCMRLTTQGFCSQQGDELWGFLVTGSKTHWEVSMQWSLKPTVWRKEQTMEKVTLLQCTKATSREMLAS